MIKRFIGTFLIINFIVVFSFGNSISISCDNIFSLNNLSDLEAEDQVDESYFSLNRKISKLKFSYLYMSSYEIEFGKYIYIDQGNLYLLDEEKEYYDINFKYHVNQRVNFPLNLTISAGRILGHLNDFNFYKLKLSKLYEQREYPLLPYLELEYFNDVFTNILGFKINLMVDEGANTSNDKKDIISIDFSILRKNNKSYFSFSTALTHPI